jgi:hypothetical protein
MTVREGAIRSQINDGAVTIYKAGQRVSELPGRSACSQRKCQQNEVSETPRSVRGRHD